MKKRHQVPVVLGLFLVSPLVSAQTIEVRLDSVEQLMEAGPDNLSEVPVSAVV
jgi:hypothetical protein